MNPLLNPTMISLANHENLPDLEVFGLYFELLVDVYKFIERLSSISREINSNPASKILQFQSSHPAMKLGDFEAKSTLPINRFLNETAHFTLRILDSNEYGINQVSQ